MNAKRDDMLLPEGMTCADCGWFKRCAGLGIAKPENTRCDWAPSRFAFSISKAIELKKAVREMGEDKARLEYLIQSGDYVRCRSNNISEGWVCVDALARFTSTVYETPHQAIDAAMGNTKE